jgi:hypothetical protein
VSATNRRPLISFGQDESIFRQCIFTGRAWVAPDGTRGLISKDEGQGVMVSAFVSREFGFGIELDAQELAKVNAFRRCQENNYYLDKEAAKERLDRVDGTKAALESSPFVQLFEYGDFRSFSL